VEIYVSTPSVYRHFQIIPYLFGWTWLQWFDQNDFFALSSVYKKQSIDDLFITMASMLYRQIV